MSDANWPRFEAWNLRPEKQDQWGLVIVTPPARIAIEGLSEQAARDMARDLNLAREAREYTEAHEAVIEHHDKFGVCESHELLMRLGNARAAYRAAKAKESQ